MLRSPLGAIAALSLLGLGGYAYQASETTTSAFLPTGAADTPEYEPVEIEEVIPLTTTTTSASPPSLSILCPENEYRQGSSLQAPFGHDIANTAPLARWSIDYGDGKTFQTAHRVGAEAAVFEHVYQAPGFYGVSAMVTDQNGLSATDRCSFLWAPITPTYRPPTYSPPMTTWKPPSYSPPGGYNDSGCPRDQWVNGYTRKNGTRVSGYYRNSGSDGCGGG